MVRQIQVTYAQLAQGALQVMAKAQVGADDETLALVQAARQMLRQIGDGSLVVASAETPPSDEDAPLPPQLARAQRRARGVEGVKPAQTTKGSGIKGAEGVLSEGITGAPK